MARISFVVSVELVVESVDLASADVVLDFSGVGPVVGVSLGGQVVEAAAERPYVDLLA